MKFWRRRDEDAVVVTARNEIRRSSDDLAAAQLGFIETLDRLRRKLETMPIEKGLLDISNGLKGHGGDD